MKRHTLLIQLAGQTCVHYVLTPNRTVCDEDLNGMAQFKLEYDLEDNVLCPECKQSEPVPSIKDWSFTNPIRTQKQASLSLSCLYIFYQMLNKDLRICQSLEESATFKSNVLTNHFLMDEESKIERVKDGNLIISFREENKRIKKSVSYERVGMIMNNVKKDILMTHLQIIRN